MKSKEVLNVLKIFREPVKEDSNWIMKSKYKGIAEIKCDSINDCYEQALKLLKKEK